MPPSSFENSSLVEELIDTEIADTQKAAVNDAANRSELLFAYGTLQVSAVVRKITGRCFPAQPALLKDFYRFRVKNAIYPAITKQAGAELWGVLYSGVTLDALQALDAFEGEFYVRELHPVEVNGQQLTAQVYVASPQHPEIQTAIDWDLKAFLADPDSRYYF